MCMPYGNGRAIPTVKGVSLMPMCVYCRFTEETLFCNQKIMTNLNTDAYNKKIFVVWFLVSL